MSRDIPETEIGRLTFDAEGMEDGRFHSRHFHVPSSGSGLTIGRGYDMKMRKQPDIREDLLAAGVAADKAEAISKAAKLKGDEARTFIKRNGLESFEITPEEQVALFKREYARQEKQAGTYYGAATGTALVKGMKGGITAKNAANCVYVQAVSAVEGVRLSPPTPGGVEIKLADRGAVRTPTARSSPS